MLTDRSARTSGTQSAPLAGERAETVAYQLICSRRPGGLGNASSIGAVLQWVSQLDEGGAFAA